MKSSLKLDALLLVLFPSIVFAVDLITTAGNVYSNVTVSRVEPDALVVMGKKGIMRIPFHELPQNVQNQYGYNHSNAAVFVRNKQKANVEYVDERRRIKQKKEADNYLARQNADASFKAAHPELFPTSNDPFAPPVKQENKRGFVVIGEPEKEEIKPTERQPINVPAGSPVTIIIQQRKTQSEMLGDYFQQMDETRSKTKVLK